jgi:hypothetical protein
MFSICEFPVLFPLSFITGLGFNIRIRCTLMLLATAVLVCAAVWKKALHVSLGHGVEILIIIPDLLDDNSAERRRFSA